MAEQERLREELVQSQKMGALGTLAGGIAHDFNNILVPMIREAGALLRSTMPAGIEIRYDLSANGTRIMGSAGEIHRALLNLGTNAYLAMREGGGILTLRTFRDRDTSEVVVRAEDEGVGIPLEIQTRVFDPFYTTRGPGEGTGLGLAIVQRIVTGLRGTLHLTSEPGVGTTVDLRFPETADGRRARHRGDPQQALRSGEPPTRRGAGTRVGVNPRRTVCWGPWCENAPGLVAVFPNGRSH